MTNCSLEAFAPLPLNQLDYVAFDLETTGLQAISERIIEIGAVRFRFDQPEIQTYQQLVNPQKLIPAEVIPIHGITDKMVADQPLFSEIAPSFLKFIEGAILVAHNAPFDLAFLSLELQAAGLDFPPNPGLDTCRLSRLILKDTPNHKLQTLAQRFQAKSTGPAHRSLPDSLACAAVFQGLVGYLNAGPLTTFGELVERFPQIQSSFRSLKEGSPQLSSHLQQAISTRQQVNIWYHNARNEKLKRTVTPFFLGGTGDFLYLEAFCHLRQQQRQFRLDRITEIEFPAGA